MEQEQNQNQHSYIVIVEDSEIDYEIIQRSLRKVGFAQAIKRYKGGEQAYDFLATLESGEINYPDFILLDLNLPGVDGKEILKKIKTHPELKKVPVIVLTTTGSEQEIKDCYSLGANSYLQKPLKPDDYLAMSKALKEFWDEWARLPSEIS